MIKNIIIFFFVLCLKSICLPRRFLYRFMLKANVPHVISIMHKREEYPPNDEI